MDLADWDSSDLVDVMDGVASTTWWIGTLTSDGMGKMAGDWISNPTVRLP